MQFFDENNYDNQSNFGNSQPQNSQQQNFQTNNYSTAQNLGAQGMHTAKIPPTNLPPTNSSETGPLNKSEITYLENLANQNYLIKKKSKKYTKARITENARVLNKIRRMYSTKMGHRYFGFPILTVNKLRLRIDDDKRGSFGAAARRTKRLVLTIVIIVAILATLGTASVVTVMAINNRIANTFTTEGFIISNSQNIPPYINNYVLGRKVDLPIKIRNNTNQDVEVRFRIEISLIPDSDLEKAVANGLVDRSKLEITYYYDEANWRLLDNMLYYIGTDGVMADSADDLEVVSGFSIDIASTEESNKWVNYSMQLNFIVDFDRASQS